MNSVENGCGAVVERHRAGDHHRKQRQVIGLKQMEEFANGR